MTDDMIDPVDIDEPIETASMTVLNIDWAVEKAFDEHERVYLGGSVIGEECWRKLWYGFRWASEPEKFDGRMLRLFRRGHREEISMVEDLRRTGVTVLEVDGNTGRQWEVSDHGGHFGGHLDGIALGVIEAPAKVHLLECKTHNQKNFRELLRKGVEIAQPHHYAQMQIYMHHMSLTRALYLAVNKNDDTYYSERVRYDPLFAMRLVAKAGEIIGAYKAPDKRFSNPNARMAFPCGTCHHLPLCHQGGWARRNCRTCVHATPELDGKARWHCTRNNIDLSPADQKAGCGSHLFLPDLVPGEQLDASAEEEWIEYALADGTVWRDGGTPLSTSIEG